MKFFIFPIFIFTIIVPFNLSSCISYNTPEPSRYKIDNDTQGLIEKVGNIYNTTIVSNDPNVYKAEYEAGFIPGRLQADQLIPSRDNTWDLFYLLGPSHSFPKQIPPSPEELATVQRILKNNWDYTLIYLEKQGNSTAGKNLRRIILRLAPDRIDGDFTLLNVYIR